MNDQTHTIYRDLGVFSGLVAAARRKRPLFGTTPPGPRTRQLVRDVLNFSIGAETPEAPRVDRRWSSDGVEGELVSWSVGFGPRTEAIFLKPAGGRSRATLIGASAIFMWSGLGLLGSATGAVPPFLLNALCFGLSGTLTTIWVASRPGGIRKLRQPPRVLAFGALGLFGFHALYFTAIRNAPPVEANLINYSWPLLIVIMSALLPGERLRAHHVAGAALGLAGVAAILLDGQDDLFGSAATIGYLAAIASALWWASYSVMSRRMPQVPSEAVAVYCLITAILSLLAHAVLEDPVWPSGAGQWGAVVLLGVFPVGLAFFAWDHGMKHGSIQVLGAGAYAAPLLSTLAMIAAGYGTLTPLIAAACMAISLGALIAARDLVRLARAARSGETLDPLRELPSGQVFSFKREP